MKTLRLILAAGLLLLMSLEGSAQSRAEKKLYGKTVEKRPPVCKDKKTDRYIRSIYFENDGTTLDVVYYKARTTFKNKISLNGQTISHLK